MKRRVTKKVYKAESDIINAIAYLFKLNRDNKDYMYGMNAKQLIDLDISTSILKDAITICRYEMRQSK